MSDDGVIIGVAYSNENWAAIHVNNYEAFKTFSYGGNYNPVFVPVQKGDVVKITNTNPNAESLYLVPYIYKTLQ